MSQRQVGTRRGRHQAPARTRQHGVVVTVALGLATLAAGIALAHVALAGAAPTPSPSASAGAPAGPLSGPPARGRSLYLSNCASCHGQQGGGSQRGPSLIGVGAASADFQLSTGRMPLAKEEAMPPRGKPAFGRADIDALVGYVASLGPGPAIPALAPGDLTLGRSLYLQNCAACHSSGGVGYAQVGGRAAPSLLSTHPRQVAEAIRVGPNLMPVYPKQTLDDRQVDALVAYVGHLQQTGNRGGLGLGRLGPVAETLVGFVAIALLLLVIRGLGQRAA